MTSSLLSQSYLKGHWELVAEGAASAGRQADRSQWRIARDVFVAPTLSLARERARAVLGRNFVQHQLPNRAGSVQMKSTKLDPDMPDEAVDVDYLMEHVWIVGDPQECADKIRQLYEACGGFGTLLSITADSDEASWDHDSLRLLIEAVGPRVADLT
jgi:alkanesulfonate monooxygenase SsuD/methylene tetrahydromethanopterin reductase-like flavin-dependent oxidoreductase (luciferase family)